MSFSAELVDPETGARRRAYVAHFVVEDGTLVAIANVKPEATEHAAREAREELEAFLDFLRSLQARKDAADLVLMFGEEMMAVAGIDVDAVGLVTYGPLGGKDVGFDEEMDLSEADLAQLAEELIAEHGPAREGDG